MSIIRIGSTKKYSDGWETAFRKTKKASPKNVAVKKSSKKKAKKK